jgi:hypothetical protein
MSARSKTEGVLHEYPKGEARLHDMSHGAAGCWCEPEVKELVIEDNKRIVTRVIVHQSIRRKV